MAHTEQATHTSHSDSKNASTAGTITQIIGPVVDVRFDPSTSSGQVALPAIKNALHVAHNNETITLEVAQHLGLNRVRCISMGDTAGLSRGLAD
jgi:F-type H+-transporting ATPase subunit beta